MPPAASGRVLFVAALFALHPINVESVAWVAERKNVLSTFFFFAALIAYCWYARKPDWRRYLAFAGLFVLGLMSKPMVITLPFVLLLLDYWPLGRIQGGPAGARPIPQASLSRLLVEKLPLLALSAASAVVTMQAQRAGGTRKTRPRMRRPRLRFPAPGHVFGRRATTCTRISMRRSPLHPSPAPPA